LTSSRFSDRNPRDPEREGTIVRRLNRILLGLGGFIVVVLATAEPAAATFPGQNGKIAFASGTTSHIYTMNPDGGAVSQLTHDALSDFRSAWSADGSKLVLESFVPEHNRDIFVVNADGTGRVQLTNTFEDELMPTWSPDRRHIAFVLIGDIYTMNSDGTGVTNLTNHSFDFAFSPSWSPDGSKIAFDCVKPLGGEDICVMNADGSDVRNLTPENPNGVDGLPDWSPDGTKLVYISAGLGQSYDIFTMNADGSGKRNLTNNHLYNIDPKWSPDGTKIVWDRGYQDIYVMNADGTGVTRLTDSEHGFSGSVPSWQPIPETDMPPASPTDLVADSGNGTVTLDWSDNAEPDLDHYDVFRSTAIGGPYTKTSASPVTVSDYLDIGLVNGATYYYVVTAVDKAGNSSGYSAEVSGTPTAPATPPGPQRSDFKNDAKFCKAKRAFLGESTFRSKYGGGANSFGKCVSAK
jgi:dipeptidyl aminopeptidase/acylaminoacyl peptidase